MFLFDKLREKKVEKIIEKVNNSNLVKRYIMLIVGIFCAAVAYKVFFLQYGIVCFGVSGFSIVLNEFGVNPDTFVLVANLLLLVVSFIFLGVKATKNSIIGSLLFPIFAILVDFLIPFFPLENVELVVIAIFGAVLMGLGSGLVFKAGFTAGGTDILNQILCKYFKLSMGKSILIVDGLVVMSAKLAFSWEIVLYGFLVLYIISMVADRVLIGISKNKAFYIVTDKEDDVREFLLSIINGGVTLINVRGGHTGDKKTMLFGVVPTSQYFLVKEGLKAIDENIFFLVCDAYEVSNKGDFYESF